MEKRALKKILVILMILMIISTDFFVLGSNLVSYAVENNNATNNKNIEFSAYFKDSNGKKQKNCQQVLKQKI